MRTAADLPPPPTDQLRLAYEASGLVLTLAGRLLQGFTARAAEFGLAPPQMKVLLALEADEEAPMRSVAARLDYDSSNLTNLVDRLEARGLIARRPDPTDRRVKAVVLTAEGRRVRDAFWRTAVASAGGLETLTEEQLTTLRALLGAAAGGAQPDRAEPSASRVHSRSTP